MNSTCAIADVQLKKSVKSLYNPIDQFPNNISSVA